LTVVERFYIKKGVLLTEAVLKGDWCGASWGIPVPVKYMRLPGSIRIL
jgi:hypothetical protein